MKLPTIPGLDAARAAIEPYMLIVKLVAGLILIGLVWWGVATVRGWHADSLALDREVAKREAAEANLAAEIACEEGSACAGRALQAARDGAQAVKDAVKAAQEAASAEQARVAAEGQAAVQRAQAAASVAAVRLRDAEAKYRAALSDPATGCAEQARAVLRCPLK